MCATYGKAGGPCSRSNTSSYHEFSPAVLLDLGSWSLSNVQGEFLYNDNIRQLFVPEKKKKSKKKYEKTDGPSIGQSRYHTRSSKNSRNSNRDHRLN